jgi:hypothetical protein
MNGDNTKDKPENQVTDKVKIVRDKNGFVPVGYFLAGFCTAMSMFLYFTEGYLTVNIYSIDVVPLWMWYGSVAAGLGAPVLGISKGLKP